MEVYKNYGVTVKERPYKYSVEATDTIFITAYPYWFLN